jgi:hypothetical protein
MKNSRSQTLIGDQLGGAPGQVATWRRVILVLATTTAMAGAMAAPESATVVDQGHFVIEEQFPPRVVTDLPCLEGKEFLATGSAVFRGTFVDAGDDGFHFSQIEKFEGTAVPVGRSGANVRRKRLGASHLSQCSYG